MFFRVASLSVEPFSELSSESKVPWRMSVISIQPEQSQQNKNNMYNSMDGLYTATGLLPDTQNCGLRMHRECRERFPRHRLQRKSVVSDPNIHRGTCFTHVSWCMSESLTSSGGEKVSGIPGACATHILRIWQEARGDITQ